MALLASSFCIWLRIFALILSLFTLPRWFLLFFLLLSMDKFIIYRNRLFSPWHITFSNVLKCGVKSRIHQKVLLKLGINGLLFKNTRTTWMTEQRYFDHFVNYAFKWDCSYDLLFWSINFWIDEPPQFNFNCITIDQLWESKSPLENQKKILEIDCLELQIGWLSE